VLNVQITLWLQPAKPLLGARLAAEVPRLPSTAASVHHFTQFLGDLSDTRPFKVVNSDVELEPLFESFHR
jgi:hypothetical protein